MININTLKTYCDGLGKKISADKTVYVVQEDHLQKKLHGQAGTFLVVVLPSGHSSGEADNLADLNTMMFFIIKSVNKSDVTDTKELEDYQSMLTSTSLIKQQLIADADSFISPMSQLERSSIETDPVWNVAGSFYGYSLTFNFLDHD